MFLRILIWTMVAWGIPSLSAQHADWISQWAAMPADTSQIRFLHKHLKEARSLPADSMLFLAQKGYELAERLEDQRGMAAMHLYQGLGNAYQGIFEAAAYHFEQAAHSYEALKDRKQTGSALTNLGLSYYSLGDDDQALQSYLAAAEKFAYIQQPNSRLYNNIAIIYRKQKKYDRAIEYYQESLKLKEAEQDHSGMAAVWFNLANLQLYQQDTTRAIFLAKQALTRYEQLKDVSNIAASHALLGSIYRRTQQIDSAKQELEAAWEYYEVHQEGGYFLICVSELAHLSAREEEWDKAEQYFQLAIQTAHEQQAKEELYALLREYGAALAQLGRTRAAYDSLNKSYALRENITETERLAMEEEMQARFEVQQAEQREQLQQQSFQEQQRQSRLILVLIGLLLIGALVFLWMNVRKNRRLRQKQQEVEEALHAKEAIMREMHHRVKNNLQFLSSLLRLQARHLEDEQAQEALLHSRSRVLSMALIHNHLYEEEGRTAIRMDAYLNKLITDVLKSLQLPYKDIQVQTEVESIILDVDQAIPVALITHEALVNAMKYAFEGRNTGQLTVSMRTDEMAGSVRVSIDDDGIGKNRSGQGFGQRLMDLMAERLKGNLRLVSDAGFHVFLDFPLVPIDYAKN